jgi:hypothetical protein
MDTYNNGDKVRIPAQFCSDPAEAEIVFTVVEDRETRVLIVWADAPMTIKPQQVVPKDMLVRA